MQVYVRVFGISGFKSTAGWMLIDYLQDAAGRRTSLVFDLSITHDRYGSSSLPQKNGMLSHPHDFEVKWAF